MKKSNLIRQVVRLIKANIEDCDGGSVLTNGKTEYKFIFDNNGGVGRIPQWFNTPTGCIGVDKWQYGNGFDINGSTTDDELKKVAKRVVDEYENTVKSTKEIEQIYENK